MARLRGRCSAEALGQRVFTTSGARRWSSCATSMYFRCGTTCCAHGAAHVTPHPARTGASPACQVARLVGAGDPRFRSGSPGESPTPSSRLGLPGCAGGRRGRALCMSMRGVLASQHGDLRRARHHATAPPLRRETGPEAVKAGRSYRPPLESRTVTEVLGGMATAEIKKCSWPAHGRASLRAGGDCAARSIPG